MTLLQNVVCQVVRTTTREIYKLWRHADRTGCAKRYLQQMTAVLQSYTANSNNFATMIVITMQNCPYICHSGQASSLLYCVVGNNGFLVSLTAIYSWSILAYDNDITNTTYYPYCRNIIMFFSQFSPWVHLSRADSDSGNSTLHFYRYFCVHLALAVSAFSTIS